MDFENHSERILIIDDNKAIHEDFKKLLKPASNELKDLKNFFFSDSNQEEPLFPSFEIDSAFQGEEGYHCVIRSLEEKRPFFLSFVDIRMPPGWDGVETIEKIWRVDSDIQTVICTAYSDYAWQEMVQKLGFSDRLMILKKPFDIIEVRQLSIALSKKWTLLRERRSQVILLQSMIDERTTQIRATLEATQDGLLVISKQKERIDYNINFIHLWNQLEWKGKSIEFYLQQKDIEQLTGFICNNVDDISVLKSALVSLLSNFEEADLSQLHLEFQLKNGNAIELFSRPLLLKQTLVGRVLSFRNVTHRKRFEAQLTFQATHDLLTHLPNRVLLIDRLEQAIYQTKRHNHQIVILFLDLDRFKNVNDSLGHNFGDAILKSVAERLSLCKRETDTLCRIGGDEFVFILPDISEKQSPPIVIKKIQDVFKNPFVVEDKELSITASIGICCYPTDGTTADTLLKNADAAMYCAKAMGKNRIQFFEHDMDAQIKQRLELEQNLYLAYKLGELLLHYQPLIDVKTGAIAATEALLRWKHPTLGFIEPKKFIPIAEETGLINPISEWVLKTACEQNLYWQKQGLPAIPIAVNLSGIQLKSREQILIIEKVLDQTNYDGRFLELELTENVLMAANLEINKIFLRLRERGVSFVIDDFGTGYSNLAYLMSFPISKLKIDKSFFDELTRDPSKSILISALITMAHSINLKVVAEGIETRQQYQFLCAHDCDQIQGFYFSKPIPSDEYAHLLQTGLGATIK